MIDRDFLKSPASKERKRFLRLPYLRGYRSLTAGAINKDGLTVVQRKEKERNILKRNEHLNKRKEHFEAEGAF